MFIVLTVELASWQVSEVPPKHILKLERGNWGIREQEKTSEERRGETEGRREGQMDAPWSFLTVQWAIKRQRRIKMKTRVFSDRNPRHMAP